MRRLAVAALALALTAGSAVATAGPSSAQTPASGVTARLAGQTLFIGPDATASIVLDVAGPLPDDTEVAVVVHNRLAASRQTFREAAGGTIPTAPYRVIVTALPDVPRDPAGRLSVSVPTTSARSSNATSVPIRAAGVYPIEVLLRSGDRNDELARVVTFLVRVPDQPVTNPLRLALVLPLTGPPALQPDGSTVIPSDLRQQAQLLADTLSATPDLPATVLVQPELLEALSRSGLPTDENLRARLSELLRQRQSLPSPYVGMDAAAAVAAGLSGELVNQLTHGEDVLAEQLGSNAGARTTWATTAGLDEASVAFLRELGFRQLIVPERAIDDLGDATPMAPANVAAGQGDRPLVVATADESLSGAFGPHAEPVRDAYFWLAEVALLALVPNEAQTPRGLVVMPRAWTADPSFFGTVVAGLRGNPLVQATTADQWFQAVPVAEDRGGNPVSHELAAVEPDDLSDYASTLTRTRGALTAYGSMMPATSSTPGELARLLDVTPASALDAGARDAYLGAVNRQLDSLRRSVDPVATRTITLAGQTTELPLTITSNADEAIQVRLRLTSSKLAFPDGNERLVTVTDGATQVRVPVEARASGTFPVTVDLLTPTGSQPVAPSTQLTVRSTGLSGLGLAVSVGALIVLALWWLRHLYMARRRKRNAASLVRHPSTSASPAGLTDATSPPG